MPYLTFFDWLDFNDRVNWNWSLLCARLNTEIHYKFSKCILLFTFLPKTAVKICKWPGKSRILETKWLIVFLFYIYVVTTSDSSRRSKVSRGKSYQRIFDLNTFNVNLSRISITNSHSRSPVTRTRSWMENPSDFRENPGYGVAHFICVYKIGVLFKPWFLHGTIHQNAHILNYFGDTHTYETISKLRPTEKNIDGRLKKNESEIIQPISLLTFFCLLFQTPYDEGKV